MPPLYTSEHDGPSAPSPFSQRPEEVPEDDFLVSAAAQLVLSKWRALVDKQRHQTGRPGTSRRLASDIKYYRSVGVPAMLAVAEQIVRNEQAKSESRRAKEKAQRDAVIEAYDLKVAEEKAAAEEAAREAASVVQPESMAALASAQGTDAAEAAAALEADYDAMQTDSKAWYAVGYALEDAGLIEAAEACLTQALVIEPSHIDAAMLLGNLSRGDGDLARARRCYEAALPSSERELKRAVGKQDKLVAIERVTRAQYNLAIVCHQQDDCETAVGLFEKVAAKGSPSALYNLGKCLTDLHRYDAAKSAYEKALKLNPEDPDTLSAHKNLVARIDRVPLLTQSFNLIDDDGNGYVTLDELIGYGNVIGMRWTPEEAQEVLNTIDKNSDGKLSLEEWISFTESEVCDASSTASDALRSVKAFINVSLLPSDRVEAIKALYAAIDVNGDGAIDDEELLRYATAMNPDFDASTLPTLMKRLDLNKDGLVSESDYVAYFAKLSSPMDEASFWRNMDKYTKAIDRANLPEA